MTAPSAPALVGERAALATLASVDGVGSQRLTALVERYGSATAVLERAAAGASVRIAPDPEPTLDPIVDRIRVAAADPKPALARIRALGLAVLTPNDAAYPTRLTEIEDPPPLLFVRGDCRALSRLDAVAVVGTRRPTAAGRATAARIARALARAGATVVSGLAVGIDGAAHAATLAEGGLTVAVIGGGHAELTPPVHARLAEAIVSAGGAIVSEHAPDTAPTRGTFPRRNRVISGLADGVVVVEAGARSGALLTASWALQQGRDCFLVPGPIDAPASAGCLGFLRDWPGLARVVAGVPQLLDDLGLPGAAGLEPPRGSARRDPAAVGPTASGAVLVELPEADAAVGRALLGGAVTVDEIVAVTGLAVGAVLGAVTRLEGRGLAEGEYGRYRPAGLLQ